MGDSKTSSNSTTTSSPWLYQAGYLTDAFNKASLAYNQNMDHGAYTGNYVAPTNQNQYNAANSEYNTAMGSGTNANNSVLGQSNSLINQGNSATSSALSGLGSLLGSNTTSNLVNQANSIASGFNVQDDVNAAMQAANTNAAENTIPNLYRSAASAGNLNSDRTALSQGVVERGLQQTATNLAGQLANQNYHTGLNTALSQNQQNLSGYSSLGSLGASLGQSGLNGLSTYINNAGTLANQAQAGADKVQSLDQSAITNSLDQYNGTASYPWTALQKYYSIIGGNNWGSYGTSSGTTTSSPSTLSMIGSGLGALGSLFS